ncbi:hypothetical protein PUNSTDRAFT_134519 [Punctularia strigosozonata HHB-11173 SS5]|uniref:uncharacterized protein n=1 Tax=Punctularia strigosozonata (strain HHB-11173) TaxID=741275 RepID=UPI000441677C|nr:uncharacterized protein PUNSTDRAFT_134519 [Punctularia strigosozonata HHB-11173 SS5]EIN09369.1 hypothetical protein PUNSTDRAFT_134519 [Punctularia strigosozonata HHB-11173 SS5]
MPLRFLGTPDRDPGSDEEEEYFFSSVEPVSRSAGSFDDLDHDTRPQEPLATLTVDLPKLPCPAPEPAVLESAWYAFLTQPEQDRKEKAMDVLAKFEPFRHLPPELDALSNVQKSKPPELFLGIPLERKMILKYAAKYDLFVYVNRTKMRPVGWKPRDEVTRDLAVSVDSTAHFVFKDIQVNLWSRLRFDFGYGKPGPGRPFLSLWVLCSNFDSVDERPSPENLAELREELGLNDIKWYLSMSM